MLLDEKLGSIFANSNHSSIEIREIQIYQLYNIIKADVFVLFFGIGGASAVENLYISAFGIGLALVGCFLVLSLSIPFIKIELNKFMKCAGRPFHCTCFKLFYCGIGVKQYLSLSSDIHRILYPIFNVFKFRAANSSMTISCSFIFATHVLI